jgi:hypothetical protein
MSSESRSRGMRIVPEGDSIHVVDVHCGECVACRAGLDFWCLDPLEEGVQLFSLATPAAPDELQRWLGALAALSTTSSAPDAVLLVLEDVDLPAATELVRPWHPGPVLASVDGRDDDARTRLLELSPTGRAQVVLTLRAARTAVRSVQRGGLVCLPDAAVDAPSVTELVQRDVKLVAARKVHDLVEGSSWADLGRRLERVLEADDSSVRTGR